MSPQSTVGAVVPVTDGTFADTVLSSDLPVLVDVWAAWCPPCAAIARSLAELAGEFAGRARIVAVDADENPQTILGYQIRAMPTLLLFRGGELVGTVVGARPKSALRDLLTNLVEA